MKRTMPLVVIQCYEDRQSTLSLRKLESLPAQPLRRQENLTNGNGVVKNDYPQPKRETTDIPPPPPPMPTTNGHQNGNHRPIEHIKPTPLDLKAPNLRKNGTLTRTPTPDYNNKMDTLKNIKDDKAELESLESYKLKNPLNVAPKPPSNYFVKAPNGTTTMKKLTRPVSVTIGEYAYGGAGRREPTKLEFLNGDKPDVSNSKLICDDDTSISNRLQSELVMTLSRSNLRKKTEVLTDATRS